MGFNCGIVGLPNAGKSTIFNALTAAGVPTANYPFCTIDPNVGIAKVPDIRLDKIADIIKPEKIVHTVLEFVDIAGLVKGASHGEGLGNQFLSHIRNVDAIVHVLRAFEESNVSHVYETVDPVRDAGLVNTELILADLEAIERRIEKAKTAAKSGEKKSKELVDALIRIKREIEKGIPARKISSVNEVNDLFLLTSKPCLYVLNVGEANQEKNNELESQLRSAIGEEDAGFVWICGKLEEETLELDGADRKEFLKEMNINESGLDKLVKSGYALLDLITFFTTRNKEVKAWTLKKGKTAFDAAGRIHTDFQKGFIKAEVCSFDELVALGSEHALREKGHMRIEGKDYLVKDGDIIHFRFNV